MRASRLVSLLLMLQSHGRMTAEELAAALEVSVRTIYRDVEALAAAGVPVYGEPGHEGGYRLVDGYRTRLTGLNEAEAEALFLAGLPAAAQQLGLAPASSSALLKLRAALPARLGERAGEAADRFFFDVPPWYHEAEGGPQLATLATATLNRRTVRIRYRRWAEPHEVTRKVKPYGLVLKAGTWYLVAERPAGFRTYRVSRVLRVQLLDQTFDRAEGFDLTGFWRDYLEEFDRRRQVGTAVLRLSPEGVLRLPQVLEPAAAQAARQTAQKPDSSGWTRVSIPVESVAAAVPVLLGLGAEAEVLAPEELRQHLVRTLGEMIRIYGPPNP